MQDVQRNGFTQVLLRCLFKDLLKCYLNVYLRICLKELNKNKAIQLENILIYSFINMFIY